MTPSLPPASFVWLDPPGNTRAAHVRFRRSFALVAAVRQARLHLFADAHYRLWVNGRFVCYGPARFFPAHPCYDTIDLAPYLQRGTNVIAVLARYHGTQTFITIPNQAGFCAWGKVETTEGATVDLATPGAWLAYPPRGYDTGAARFSFTSGPLQIYDARKDDPHWKDAKVDPEGWEAPQLVDPAGAWGPLTPRSFPLLDHREQEPVALLRRSEVSIPWDVHGFRVNGQAGPGRAESRERWFAAAWLHAPEAATINVLTHWGEFYVNGADCPHNGAEETAPGLYSRPLALQQGWNFVLIHYGMVGDAWDFCLLLPRAAGLRLAASPDDDAPSAFNVSGPHDADGEIVAALNREGHATLPETPQLAWKPYPSAPYLTLPSRYLGTLALSSPRLPARPAETAPVTIAADTPQALLYDFGGIVLGAIFVEYEAPAGTVIDVGYSEDLGHGRPTYDKNNLVFSAEREIAAGGRGRLETFDPRGFRYLELVIQAHDTDVVVHRVGIVRHVYPHQRIGRVTCSDTNLTEISDLGWNALVVNAEDVYTDCPWRERTLYGGDLLPTIGIAAATTGDLRLTRRSLEIFLQSQDAESLLLQSHAPLGDGREPLFDYPLITVVALDWYRRLTGDRDFVAQAYPRLRAMLTRIQSLETRDGFVPLLTRPFLDHGRRHREGVSGPVQFIAAMAWEALGRMAAALGEEHAAKALAQYGQALARRARQRFWRGGDRAFVENLEADGKPGTADFVPANAWPLFSGVASPEQAVQALARIEAQVDEAIASQDFGDVGSPYGFFYVLGGCYRYGHLALAERLMRKLWQPMLDAGSDTTWEMFDDRKSLAHVWSCAPTYYLATEVLGVPLGLPEVATKESVVIAPQAESLTWARGTVCRPEGRFHVSWKRSGDNLTVRVMAPPGASVTVAPRGPLRDLELDAHVVMAEA